MAHKSKTQRQKAAAAKAAQKDREERDAKAAENAALSTTSADEKKGGLFKSKADKPATNTPAKTEQKPKKQRFQFLKDVRAEMKRVTWPTRTDVIRWSGVVVGALIFFGVYVAVLDNLIIAPGLVALSGLGA